jgi:hypothetical protein
LVLAGVFGAGAHGHPPDDYSVRPTIERSAPIGLINASGAQETVVVDHSLPPDATAKQWAWNYSRDAHITGY